MPMKQEYQRSGISFYQQPVGVTGPMSEETKETQESWEESHPWLSALTKQDEDDSVDEVIRYTLDELRFA